MPTFSIWSPRCRASGELNRASGPLWTRASGAPAELQAAWVSTSTASTPPSQSKWAWTTADQSARQCKKSKTSSALHYAKPSHLRRCSWCTCSPCGHRQSLVVLGVDLRTPQHRLDPRAKKAWRYRGLCAVASAGVEVLSQRREDCTNGCGVEFGCHHLGSTTSQRTMPSSPHNASEAPPGSSPSSSRASGCVPAAS